MYRALLIHWLDFLMKMNLVLIYLSFLILFKRCFQNNCSSLPSSSTTPSSAMNHLRYPSDLTPKLYNLLNLRKIRSSTCLTNSALLLCEWSIELRRSFNISRQSSLRWASHLTSVALLLSQLGNFSTVVALYESAISSLRRTVSSLQLNKPKPLHLEKGLTKVCRDFVCELGPLSLIMPA